MRFKPHVIGPTIVATAGAIMLIWTWGGWTDPVVDFGREIYVPWQLSEGKVLYRDIVSYFNGPLSPYLHALLFKLFGVSLRTLVVFNLVVIAILAALLYRLIALAAGHLSATAAGVTFLTLFAFAQFLITGNYNYVTPYSYELTHGLTLSLATITCVVEWRRRRRRWWIGAAGALLGLVMLTKAEIALAAAIATAAGLLGSLWCRRVPLRPSLIDIGTFVGSLLAVDLLVWIALLLHLSPGQALLGMLGAWRWVGDRTLLDLPYFKELAGTADVGRSLATILTWTLGYAIVLGAPAVVGRVIRKPGLPAGVFIVIALAGWWMGESVHWDNFIRPLPLVFSVAGMIYAIGVACRRDDATLPMMLCVWAVAMLAKIPLNAHIYHYGFALAMPATMVGIALLLGWLPCRLDSLHGRAALRAAVLAGLSIAIVVHGNRMKLLWSIKTTQVGAGADAFRADPRGRIINGALAELKRLAPRGGTLAVVPEGLILNYLARMPNPTGQLNFTPPAVIMYGEAEMLRAFRAHPPDFVILTGVDTAEYGARFFGDDYARQLGAWIQENYTVQRVIGARPFRDEGFGVVILRKSASAN